MALVLVVAAWVWVLVGVRTWWIADGERWLLALPFYAWLWPLVLVVRGLLARQDFGGWSYFWVPFDHTFEPLTQLRDSIVRRRTRRKSRR